MKRVAKSLLALAVAAGLGAAAPALAAGGVKIGVLSDMSGPNADLGGKGSVVAAQMAIDEFGGKMLGQPIELIQALKQRFPGTATRIYYGSTECGSATTLADADVLRKPGSVGPASPGVELRLSAEGEIQVRSPYLMSGYFDDPGATCTSE